MNRILGDPTTCPHGNPIPGSHYVAPDQQPLSGVRRRRRVHGQPHPGGARVRAGAARLPRAVRHHPGAHRRRHGRVARRHGHGRDRRAPRRRRRASPARASSSRPDPRAGAPARARRWRTGRFSAACPPAARWSPWSSWPWCCRRAVAARDDRLTIYSSRARERPRPPPPAVHGADGAADRRALRRVGRPRRTDRGGGRRLAGRPLPVAEPRRPRPAVDEGRPRRAPGRRPRPRRRAVPLGGGRVGRAVGAPPRAALQHRRRHRCRAARRGARPHRPDLRRPGGGRADQRLLPGLRHRDARSRSATTRPWRGSRPWRPTAPRPTATARPSLRRSVEATWTSGW